MDFIHVVLAWEHASDPHRQAIYACRIAPEVFLIQYADQTVDIYYDPWTILIGNSETATPVRFRGRTWGVLRGEDLDPVPKSINTAVSYAKDLLRGSTRRRPRSCQMRPDWGKPRDIDWFEDPEPVLGKQQILDRD